MNEEIDESGCYLEDFSTESDWEVFNAQLVEVLQKWKLDNGDWGRKLSTGELFTCQWRVEAETLQLLKNDITVRYYAADLKDLEKPEATTNVLQPQTPVHLDLMSMENTFGLPVTTNTGGNLHSLARLFGLRRFVVIHPADPQSFLSNPSEFSFFLSSANVVAAEVCSTVPLFVQIYVPSWNYFVGVHVSPSMRINFDVVSMNLDDLNKGYFNEFRTLFKNKLPVAYVRPAVVSVRQTYHLRKMQIHVPLRVPFSTSSREPEESGPFSDIGTGTRFTALPYGYNSYKSQADVYAIFTWPEVAETIAFDSALRSEFVPSKAHIGSVHQVAEAEANLSSCLKDFKKLAGSAETVESFVGRNFANTTSALGAANPLDQLTEHRLPHLRSPRQAPAIAMAQRKDLPGPMKKNELNEMLLYLFPNMNPEDALYPYPKAGPKEEFDPLRIKSAAPDSLVARLSCLLATCHSHFGRIGGLAQLWAAFVRELHILVDNCVSIPGVAPGFPDTRTCLLHQKLQLLNVCIERRRKRELGETEDDECEAEDKTEHFKAKKDKVKDDKTEDDKTEDDQAEDNETEDENDEFYECDDDDEDQGGSGDRKLLEVPEGRRHRLGDLKLLGCDEPLYVPKLQIPVPKTEDQQNEDAEVMMQLGPDSGLTTQMMCPLLYSDMEAFKAANPKAAIEDFIRWYSPKDWEETVDDDGKTVGQLSGRMAVPNNMWQTVWNQVHPVPASRQKRLFDDTKEALKVLHYLESRSIGEIHDLVLVPLLHSAILKLQDVIAEIEEEVGSRSGSDSKPNIRGFFSPTLDAILAALCRLSRDPNLSQNDSDSAGLDDEALLEQMAELELRIYRFMCYEQSFKRLHLVRSREEIFSSEAASDFRIELDPSRDVECLTDLPMPLTKDYVIRVDGETESTSKGVAGPQFLRAIVKMSEGRLTLCGAFSENTTFI